MAAKKTTAQQLAKLKRDDETFASLSASMADDTAGVFAACKTEVDKLRKGSKRSGTAVTRLRKRLARVKATMKKDGSADSRKAVRNTETDLAKAVKAKLLNTTQLAAARERMTAARALAAKHKKYAAVIGQADRAMSRTRRKKRSARKKA